MQDKCSTFAHKALEITMRDSKDNLEDFAAAFAYQSTPHTLHIVPTEGWPMSASKSNRDTQCSACDAKIYKIPLRRSSDVVSYLLERESRESHAVELCA